MFFTEQLFSGDLYPRWLVDYPEGLGSPVFYFYGPMPFYLASLIDAVACFGCSTPQVLSVTNAALFAISGLVFYVWLSRFVGRTACCIGAIFYMALPYHYLDIEVRGAIGESMAYVWLPVIFVALERMLKCGYACVLVALAYTGLILSHLPSALLAVPFMALYVAVRAGPHSLARSALRLAGAGLLGVAMSAVYLVPALMMRDMLLPGAWLDAHGEGYLPENWLVFGNAVIPAFGLSVYRSLAVVSLLAVIVWCLARFLRGDAIANGPERATNDARVLAAAFVSIGTGWFLMSAPTAWLWTNIEPLRNVQFPWRLGTLIDFFSATIIALSVAKIVAGLRNRLARRGWPVSWSICVYGILLLVPCLFSTINLIEYQSVFATRTWIGPLPPDFRVPTEYRPKRAIESTVYQTGMSEVRSESIHQRHERGFERLRHQLADRPNIILSRTVSAGEAVAIERVGATNFNIDADLVRSATIVVGRFYFPTWRLIDVKSGREINVKPTTETGLISFDLPAGANRLHLDIKRSGSQFYGAILSAIAALFTTLILVLRFQRKRRPV